MEGEYQDEDVEEEEEGEEYEEEEARQPTQEEMEYLELRQRLKDSIKRKRKQSGAALSSHEKRLPYNKLVMCFFVLNHFPLEKFYNTWTHIWIQAL